MTETEYEKSGIDIEGIVEELDGYGVEVHDYNDEEYATFVEFSGMIPTQSLMEIRREYDVKVSAMGNEGEDNTMRVWFHEKDEHPLPNEY